MDLARNRVEEEFAIGRKTDKYLIIVFAWVDVELVAVLGNQNIVNFDVVR